MAIRRRPAETEKEEADDRDAGPDGGKVEHIVGVTEQLLAHARDDNVGRGADKRDDAAEQGAERHRHQQ